MRRLTPRHTNSTRVLPSGLGMLLLLSPDAGAATTEAPARRRCAGLLRAEPVCLDAAAAANLRESGCVVQWAKQVR